MKSLPQDIAKVIDTMKVGEVSQAFRMMDEKTGQEICAIVKLKDRIESHRANITDDFQVLKSMILQKRQNEALQKVDRRENKKRRTRVSIRSGATTPSNTKAGLNNIPSSDGLHTAPNGFTYLKLHKT